jgi:hypothetical protein
MLGLKKQKVVDGKMFSRKLPVNFLKQNHDHFNRISNYQCPALIVYFYRTVFMLSDSSLFLFRIWPVEGSFPFFRKRIRLHSIKGVLDIQRKWEQIIFMRQEKYYLIIHDQWSRNYYHWMTQALPRLLMAFKTGKAFQLLIPQNHNSQFHKQTLKMLGVEHWTFFDNDKRYFKIENLMYPSHDIQVGDYHDDLIRELAEILQSKTESPYGLKRIFVQRTSKKSRLILNEQEVLKVFSKWNFEVVNFEEFNFQQQSDIAKSASVIAGVHGAGLTNMLFMKAGSKVLELTTALEGEQYYYYTLANALQHNYYYQQCTPGVPGLTIQESNFHVNIDTLESILVKMISS